MKNAAPAKDYEVLADRVHRHNYPLDQLFRALTDDRDLWLRLVPGEVEPRVLEATALSRVVWSSLWPVSPNDRIELDLSPAGPEHIRHTRSGRNEDRAPQSLLRMRWWTDSPPDARGIAITRQRLNQKFGGDLRGLTTQYWWEVRPQQP